MQYHLVLTERCNLSCSYCGGTRHQEGLPLDHVYSISDLKRFIEKDPEPVIEFYGGEPTLALDFMYKVMDNISAKAYTLQTNATHLSELDDAHLRRLHSILVSIDGGREVTDLNRGAGTYDKVIRNLKKVKSRGYEGDIVARMAFSKNGDIKRDVCHLLWLSDPKFDHIHWQLDVFWNELEKWNDLESWLVRYEDGISEIVQIFYNGLTKGKVLGVVPFIPLLRTLLTREPVPHIWCGSGVDSFAIMTSGNIEVCPIAPELPYSNVGNIYDNSPEDLRDALRVGPPCTECEDLWVCGGRCLFANETMFWGRDLFDRVCDATRHMISELESIVEPTRKLLERGIISKDAFDYPKLNNGCEVIP